MATVYAPPEEIKPPKFDMDREQDRKNEEAYEKAVKDFCIKNSKCPDAGKIVRFPMGDGYAQYMILDYRRILLLQLGDQYQIPDAHARGLRKADLVELVRQQEARASLFKLL